MTLAPEPNVHEVNVEGVNVSCLCGYNFQADNDKFAVAVGERHQYLNGLKKLK